MNRLAVKQTGDSTEFAVLRWTLVEDYLCSNRCQ